jgi:hypothetical protein
MHRSTLVGICGVTAATAFLVAGCGGGGGSATETRTTGAYAPIHVPAPLVPKKGGFAGPIIVDPDSMVREGTDVQVVLSPLGGRKYSLYIANTSSIGYINTFKWFPPLNFPVAKLTGADAKYCTIASSGAIQCDLKLRPPSCTCRNDGGHIMLGLVVAQKGSLQNHRLGLGSGVVRVDTATPVPWIIPSAPQTEDVPVCAKGQPSTKANPCTKHG